MRKTLAILSAFAASAVLAANNNWQKLNYDLNGSWNEAGHWSGGVPVPAAPSGEGALCQRVVFPTGSYTVTFPQGDVVSTANLTVNTYSGASQTFSGLGSRLLLAATEGDNYQKDGTAQAFRLNFGVSSGTQQGANVTVGDFRAPLALMTNFVATLSLNSDHTEGKIVLDGGLYDFLAPTGGTARTDTTITFGYEGLSGDHYADCTFATEIKNGASLRTPKLVLGTGYAANDLHISGGRHEIGTSLTMGGAKHATNPAATRLLIDGGASLVAGSSGSAADVAFQTLSNANYAKYLTHEVDMLGGSSLDIRGRLRMYGGNAVFSFRDGSTVSVAGEVEIPAASSGTGTVYVADSTIGFSNDVYVGYSSIPSKGVFIATNAVVRGSKRLRIRRLAQASFVDSDVSFADSPSISVGDYATSELSELFIGGDRSVLSAPGGVTIGNAKSSRGSVEIAGGTASLGDLYVGSAANSAGALTISGGAVSADTVAVAQYGDSSGTLTVEGGVLTAPSITVNNGAGVVELNGGTAVVSRVYRYGSGSASLSADGGTIRATAASASFISGFGSAQLGASGLTVESEYDQTIPQSFTSSSGVMGVLAYRGASTLTIPAGTTIDATLKVSGGATLSLASGASLSGLSLGDADLLAVVSVDVGSPFSVSGDVEVRNVKVVISGVLATGSEYPLIVCTGDVSAESCAAWAAAEFSASLSGSQYLEPSVADGDGGGKVLKVVVRELQSVPLYVSGVQSITTNITLAARSQLDVTVAAGGVLTVAGAVTADRIVKHGEGLLVLSADNSVSTGVALLDGRLSVPSASAVGSGEVVLSGGTFEVTGATAFVNAFKVSPENAANAVVVKTDADVAMPLPSMSGGAFLKRGAGKLTLLASASTSGFAPSATVGSARSSFDTYSFPSSGVVPSGAYCGVHVIEGELVFKGTEEGVTVTSPTDIAVGLNTLDGTVEPTLKFDGLSFVASGRTLDNGSYMDKQNLRSFCDMAHVVLTNGATLEVANWYNTRGSKNLLVNCTMAAYASMLKATTEFYVNYSDGNNKPLNEFRNGSTLLTARIGVMGNGGTNIFDGATVSGANLASRTQLYQRDNKAAYFKFTGGTTLRMYEITGNSDRSAYTTAPYVFVCDGMTFDIADGDKTLSTPKTAFELWAVGDGVDFPVPAESTWTLSLAKPILGDGRISVSGEGTLDLGGKSYANRAFGGKGVIANATIQNATIAVDMDDFQTQPDVLTFDGCLPTGRVCVDLGHTPGNPPTGTPAPFVAARYLGVSGANLSMWRLNGTGISMLRADFSDDAGSVVATPSIGGMLLMFR